MKTTNPPPDKKDEKPKAVLQSTNSAFLGPKIWKKPLNFYKYAGGENEGSEPHIKRNTSGAQFSLMNIDEFLSENNFDVDRISPPLAEDMFGRGGVRQSTPYSTESSGEASPFSLDDVEMDAETPVDQSVGSSDLASSSSNGYEMPDLMGAFVERSAYRSNPKKEMPEGKNDFLYVESKRARIEREKEERRIREEISNEFSAEELALATVPGADFDPTRRQFSSDELRPQPIIRKRQKAYVETNKKDDKYWEKRGKNNIAARRSREARRLKENQIALRTAFLEKQNNGLKAALQAINSKNEKLELEKRLLNEKLAKYESMAAFLN